ncbi:MULTISPECIES: recombinase family protein [unclassified Undibacterium]|uniref:recombinase family protein n=1 Tax=unclassified Undibacterium TaxID=2630295 RepID=UPI0034DCE8C9
MQLVWKMDCLGRDLKHLVTTVDELRIRNIGLKVLDDSGAHLDKNTGSGCLFFEVFNAMAKFE